MTDERITIPELAQKIINYLTNTDEPFAEANELARALGESRQLILAAVRSVDNLTLEPHNNFEQLYVVYWEDEE